MNRCDPKFEFSQKTNIPYSNTNETVYFIEITGTTDAMGESKRNLNIKEKLNMRSLESRHTSSTLDHNLSIAYLDSSLKTLQMMFQFIFFIFTDATVVIFSPKKAS